MVQSEHKAPVDHDSEVVDATHGFAVVPCEVVSFLVVNEVVAAQGLETDEDAPHPSCGGLFEEPGSQHRVDGRCGLPQSPHAPHTGEQLTGESGSAE